MPVPIGPSDDASDPAPAWKYRQHHRQHSSRRQHHHHHHDDQQHTQINENHLPHRKKSTTQPPYVAQFGRARRSAPSALLLTTAAMCLAAAAVAALVAPVQAGPPRYSSRIVETRTGAIRGVILELDSRHLEPVEAFKAVPYAAPPVGPLRFEAPQPLAQPWKGTRLADTFGDVCPQNHPETVNRTAALLTMPKGRYQYLRRLLPLMANQSEDCLTLNIYVPGSGNRGLEAPYSVLIFVHGESFEWGSGNPYDGSVLASYGHIIVITVNFRLGILGFLKTRSSQTPGSSGGNLGVMDIMAALQWTKENIAAFGGDPTRVTIVGHDTGAALANLVLISKTGKSLIHRAILLSGSALSPWSVIPDPDAVREEVSQQMACHLDTNGGTSRPSKDVTNDITECLRSKPLEAIMGVRLPSVRFMPSWGPYLPLDDAPDPEFAMEHTGQGFITKELMIGMTTTESYNDFNAADIQYGLEEEQRNRLLRTYVRNAFSFHLNEIFSAVRNEYTDWDKPIQHPINIRDSTMEALSDGHTVAPLIKVGYLHSRRGAKTYLFHFGYQTKDSEYPQRLGSVRGEDLPYIFGLPLVMGQPHFAQNYSRQDMGVAEAVLNFVTNFCKTGDPNEAGHQQAMLHPDYGTTRERTRYRGITWETYETTTQQYLSISLKPKMRSHYRGHKMSLWLNLIPQLHRPGDPEVSMRHHHFRERDPHYYAGNVRAESFTRPLQHYANGLGGEVSGAQESRQQDLYGPDCTPDPTAIGSDASLALDPGATDADTTNAISPAASDNSANGGTSGKSDELLHKFANSQYYSSYTAAFGVTVGVGCLLLILNIVIFAGIYYQRERLRRKSRGTRSGAAAAAAAATANNGHHQHHHHHHHQQAAASGIMPIDAVDVGDDEDGDDVEVGIASQHNSDLHRHGAAAGGDIQMTVRPTNVAAIATATSGKAKGEPPPSYTTLQQQQQRGSPCSGGHHAHHPQQQPAVSSIDAGVYAQQQQQQQQSVHYLCQTQQQQQAAQPSHHHQHHQQHPQSQQQPQPTKSSLHKPAPPTRTSSNLSSASPSPTPPTPLQQNLGITGSPTTTTLGTAATVNQQQQHHAHHAHHAHHSHHHHHQHLMAAVGCAGGSSSNTGGSSSNNSNSSSTTTTATLERSSGGGGGSGGGGATGSGGGILTTSQSALAAAAATGQPGSTSTLKKRVQIQEIPV